MERVADASGHAFCRHCPLPPPRIRTHARSPYRPRPSSPPATLRPVPPSRPPGGVKFHWLNVTGIGMNLSGGVWYSMVKMRQNKGKAAGVSVIG